MRTVVMMLAMVAVGCDDGDGTLDGGLDGADGGEDSSVPELDAGIPDAAPITLASTPYVINIVDPQAAAAVSGFLALADDADIASATRALYAVLPDDYDFVYLFAQDYAPESAGGRYVRVRSPALPSIGLTQAAADPTFGAERLKGVIALNPHPNGNGPTLHETLHHWGIFLDRSLGIGQDRETNFGAHWGTVGVSGQHGGFVAGSVRCATPSNAMPPCAPGPDGRAEYVIPAFGPTANGGDGVPYAPIELYLMGLAPASEVPPFEVLVDASFIEFDEEDDTIRMSAADLTMRTIDDVIALHGERPPAEQTEFRAAFAVVTTQPLSEADLAGYDIWAKIFSGVVESNFLLSFTDATGGRATMDARLFGD